MFLVAAYDTPDDRRRVRLARVMLDYGYRVQKSVYEMDLPAELVREMLRRLTEIIDLDQDSLRIYHICSRCLGQIELMGQAELTNQETVFIV